MAKNIIGFGGTYYTGWQLIVTDKDYHGQTIKVETYVYVKNLSTDREEACKKWGTNDVDMSLKGCTTFVREARPTYDPEFFAFGKYEGKKICEVNDYRYLFWYYNEVAGYDAARKEIIEKILLSSGEYALYKDKLVTLTEYEWHSNFDKTYNESKELLNSGLPFNIECTSSLDYCGHYFDKHRIIELIFPFKEMWYNGYLYGLPVDAKGKTKRIKGKTLMINKYDWEINEGNNLVVKVLEWKFAK